MPGFDAGEAYVAVVREAGCQDLMQGKQGARICSICSCSEGSRVPGFDAGEAYVAVVREAGCQDLMQGKHM